MVARQPVVIFCAVMVLLLLCFAGAAVAFNRMLQPVDAAAERSIHVEVEPGASTRQIASVLAEKGVIRSALLFRIHARRHHLDQKFMAGSYDFKLSMSLPEIAAKIASGDVDLETGWFTIPEGYTVEQIAFRLAGAGLADARVFLKLAADPPAQILEQHPLLRESAAAAGIKYVLEGYLFPDTYEIADGATEEEIITLMLHRFEGIFCDSLQQRCTELNMTPHQVLTLASIVEREARVDHERKRVAAVFHNRLSKSYPLESCATIQYILGEVKEVLSIADTKIDSPYNTYQNPGLPPGPVAAPGEASILATLSPEDTDYFFFVSKEDGSGEHYFSRTNAEHERYKSKAAQNKRERESGS